MEDSMKTNERKQEQKLNVWWDINCCPVPDGFDARIVRKCIDSALNKAGYFGPLSIIAVGRHGHTLNRTPHVLRDIYSSGIFLHQDIKGYTWYCSFCMDYPHFEPKKRKYISYKSFTIHLMSEAHKLNELKKAERPICRKLFLLKLRKFSKERRSKEIKQELKVKLEGEEEDGDDEYVPEWWREDDNEEWDRITL